MIIEAFLRWSETAAAADRAKAAGSLARAFVSGAMDLDNRRAAEAALTFLLDDPSPKVRLAMASALCASVEAPRALIHALCRDQIEVAGHVVAMSPLLSDGDLVDLVADGSGDIQRVVAMRQRVSPAVCAAIAEVGEAAAVCDLLDNAGAEPAALSIRRIAERFGGEPSVRVRLIERDCLPGDVRHQMIVSVSEALADFGLVKQAIGTTRVRRVTEDACLSATLELTETVPAQEVPALIEHLRMKGQITQAFMMRTLCQGNIDVFAAALVSLSQQPAARVRGIVVDGRAQALRALYAAAGIGAAVNPVFVSATLIWRDVRRREAYVSMGQVADLLMATHAADADGSEEIADLLMLVEKLNLAYRRRVARGEALAMAARAA